MTDVGSGHADRDEEARRAAILSETAETYATYARTGYAERWSDLEPGMLQAIRERDAWLLSALRPARDGTVVDLGCGDGALGKLLDESDARPTLFVGLDILEGRLAIARKEVPWGRFLQASADEIPLDDGVAKAVVAMTLFSSLKDDWFRTRVAKEIDRVLMPCGRLVVYDLRYPSPSNRYVTPVTASTLRGLFPDWSQKSRSMTLLPPLSRSRLAGGPRRYRWLSGFPPLRSHLGTVLIKPPCPS
jgi:ubiquinone/menaquinone biosynthesis C-methylase UbiE